MHLVYWKLLIFVNEFFVPNKRRSVQKALIRRRSSAKREWNNKRRATSITIIVLGTGEYSSGASLLIFSNLNAQKVQ